VLFIGGASLLIGQAILAACGWRQWSWLSPAVGLAAYTGLAWGTARLGFDGTGPLVAGLLASTLSLAFLRGRVEGLGQAARVGAPIALLALLAASIPFAVEGRFGILGTGFNVDMSQHLFAADWLSGQRRPEPALVSQGYPLGPHSLAAAGAELIGAGSLVSPFSGVTIVVPVMAALTALTVLGTLGPTRRMLATLLVAFPYLVASYLAQGAFKELYMALFLLGFALTLRELARGEPRGEWPRLARGVPLAVLAIGAIYAYSGPGLAWLAGVLGLWAVLELWQRRRSGADPQKLIRRAIPVVAVAFLVLLAGVVPEAGRIANFGGNVSAVADPTDLEPRRDEGPASDAQTVARDDASEADVGSAEAQNGQAGSRSAEEVTRRSGDEVAGLAAPEDSPVTRLSREERKALYKFNSDLGNLFGQVNPLLAFGVWPSGDFRVEPGGGGIPAAIFYLGALLGALALAIGLRAWLRRGELALPAALTTAVIIYLGALVFSTPYTTAKALQMVAPLAALIAVRELLAPEFGVASGRGIRGMLASARMRPARTILVAAFLFAAGGSSLLALANAPVGPRSYSPGLTRLSSNIDGQPTLVLAPPLQVTERHGRSFLGWELRGARPICVVADDGSKGGAVPTGISFVIGSDGSVEAPYEDLEFVVQRGQYVLWASTLDDGATAPKINPSEPTDCSFGQST